MHEVVKEVGSLSNRYTSLNTVSAVTANCQLLLKKRHIIGICFRILPIHSVFSEPTHLVQIHPRTNILKARRLVAVDGSLNFELAALDCRSGDKPPPFFSAV